MASLKPILVAHRGDPVHLPENTLASFESAITKGARAIEMDVRRSADRVWVVFHDSRLKRRTGRPGILSQTRWKTLKTLAVPSVDQVLRLCRRRKVLAFLDVKVGKRESSLFQVLRRSGWLHRTVVGAGKPPTLRRWRRLLKGFPLFWVTGVRMPVTPRRLATAKRLRLSGLAVYKRWATRRSVTQAHEAELKLFVWTIRTRTELRRFRALQVDGIMNEVWPA